MSRTLRPLVRALPFLWRLGGSLGVGWAPLVAFPAPLAPAAGPGHPQRPVAPRRGCMGGAATDGSPVEPRGRDGPLPKALSWDDAVSLITRSEPDSLGRPTAPETLGRSPEGNEQYVAFREDVKEQWCSTVDFVTARVFQWPVQVVHTDQGPRRRTCEPGLAHAGREIVFRRNDFPYWFEDGVRHDVLWASRRPPLSCAEVEECIQCEETLSGRQVIWWANPPHLKSIPQIDHVHIISRARPPSPGGGDAAAAAGSGGGGGDTEGRQHRRKDQEGGQQQPVSSRI
uniref:Uncharacterized protein n=1 Tax=Rhizochromulina marina TaxID=1034831 RepID=A0A7S2SDB3_9STRA|mmetsp:Transcript_28516/g.83400  ORF Transcript_28516/g.83400 Transcript_28516/m.83400 type:complete len:285 (+) Transcript_28516:42-896(+)